MAGRSSAGVGTIISFVLSIGAAVGCLILAIIGWSQVGQAQQDAAAAKTRLATYVTAAEENNPEVRALEGEARKANKSVGAFLREQHKNAANLAVGDPGLSASALIERLTSVKGSGGSLVEQLNDANSRVADLTAQLNSAKETAATLRADREATGEQITRIRAEYEKKVNDLKGDVDGLKKAADQYAAQIKDFQDQLTKARDEERASFDRRIEAANKERVALEDSLKIERARARELQEKLKKGQITGTDEAALVDAQIVGIDESSGNVFINRGKKDKVVLGLTFEVYTSPTMIRPDPQTGEYRRGKATVEIIRVDDTTSTARVLRLPRGNTLIAGDVLANAVYDPKKVYVFSVVGNFDVAASGQATAEGRNAIRALVEQWNGRVVDGLQGDIDFLVLGSRPVVPPAPPLGAPAAVEEEYNRLAAEAARYDEIFRQAVAASIPVLNQNRFFTLIGK